MSTILLTPEDLQRIHMASGIFLPCYNFLDYGGSMFLKYKTNRFLLLSANWLIYDFLGVHNLHFLFKINFKLKGIIKKNYSFEYHDTYNLCYRSAPVMVVDLAKVSLEKKFESLSQLNNFFNIKTSFYSF